MTTTNFAILTAAQVAHAKTLDDDDNYRIDPRPVDNENPGVGININPDADGIDPGDVVTLVGKSVAPKVMVDQQDCITYAPALAAYLLTLPWCMLETETIFAPVEV